MADELNHLQGRALGVLLSVIGELDADLVARRPQDPVVRNEASHLRDEGKRRVTGVRVGGEEVALGGVVLESAGEHGGVRVDVVGLYDEVQVLEI